MEARAERRAATVRNVPYLHNTRARLVDTPPPNPEPEGFRSIYAAPPALHLVFLFRDLLKRVPCLLRFMHTELVLLHLMRDINLLFLSLMVFGVGLRFASPTLYVLLRSTI
ncbi:unnamed protein product, partial [Mesorhabditis spiculigera]